MDKYNQEMNEEKEPTNKVGLAFFVAILLITLPYYVHYSINKDKKSIEKLFKSNTINNSKNVFHFKDNDNTQLYTSECKDITVIKEYRLNIDETIKSLKHKYSVYNVELYVNNVDVKKQSCKNDYSYETKLKNIIEFTKIEKGIQKNYLNNYAKSKLEFELYKLYKNGYAEPKVKVFKDKDKSKQYLLESVKGFNIDAIKEYLKTNKVLPNGLKIENLSDITQEKVYIMLKSEKYGKGMYNRIKSYKTYSNAFYRYIEYLININKKLPSYINLNNEVHNDCKAFKLMFKHDLINEKDEKIFQSKCKYVFGKERCERVNKLYIEKALRKKDINRMAKENNCFDAYNNNN